MGRKRFQDDFNFRENIVVEKTENVKNENFESESNKNQKLRSQELNMYDVIEMLGGYQISQHNIVPLQENTGECILCHNKTNSVDRNICYDCHEKYISEIYKKAKESALLGNSSFVFKW